MSTQEQRDKYGLDEYGHYRGCEREAGHSGPCEPNAFTEGRGRDHVAEADEIRKQVRG